MTTPAPPPLKDHALAFNLTLLVLGIVLAAATLLVGLTATGDGWNITGRVGVLVTAVAIAVIGFFKWRNEKEVKEAEQQKKLTLADELDAERLRILTITNGAFQASAKKLQDLAAEDLDVRRRQVSGFRQSIVDKACDLVRNDRPRAAYFHIEDPAAERRRMTPGYVAERGRTDEFTTEFVEGSGIDENVWSLIDHTDDAQLVQDTATGAPAGFDATRRREYRSYISVPVHAANVSFGMLTINSIETAGFTEEDAAAMRVLARLLATAEVIGLGSQGWNRLKAGRASGATSSAGLIVEGESEGDR